MIYYKKPSLIKKSTRTICEYLKTLKGSTGQNILKGFSVFLFLTVLLLYLGYLYILPKFFDDGYIESLLNNHLSKNTDLILDVDNLHINTSYNLSVKITADSLKLKHNNGTNFFTLEKPDMEINPFTLLLGYFDLDKIRTKKIVIDTIFTKKKQYDCFNNFNFNIFELKSKKHNLKLRNIHIISDELLLNLYDENINKNIYLKTSKIKLFSNGFEKPAEIATRGKIYTEFHTITDFNLNLVFKIDSDLMNKFKNRILNLNYNPLAYAIEYKYYSNADINLKIIPKDKKQNINGQISLKDYSFELNNYKLPKNNIILLFKGDKISADCNFNFIKKQFIKLKLFIDISRNKSLELKLVSNKLNLNELSELSKVFAKIAGIKFNLDDIDINGETIANLYIKSNFKSIISNGSMKLNNVSLYHKKLNLNINKINSDINFDGNQIKISSFEGYVNDAKFTTTGSIDKKTNLNLSIKSEPVNIAKIIKLIKSIPCGDKILRNLKDYSFESGLLKVNSSIRGTLKSPLISTNSTLDNLKIKVQSLNLVFSSKNILINSYPSIPFSDFSIKISDAAVFQNKNKITIPLINANLKKDTVTISKTPFNFDNIKGFFKGTIKNCTQTPDINIELNADIPSKNKLFIINNKNLHLFSLINIKDDKINIPNCELYENKSKLLSLSGSADKNTLYNIKIDILKKISIILPHYDNLSSKIIGRLNINGQIKSPDISGNMNLYDTKCEKYSLYIKDTLLNIKNSSAYINIIQGKIFDNSFDMTGFVSYIENAIIADKIELFSPFVDFDNLQYILERNNASIPNIKIKSFKGTFAQAKVLDIPLADVLCEGNIDNYLITIDKFSASLLSGNAQGKLKINIKNNKNNIELLLKNISVRHLTNKIKQFSIAASGHLNAVIKADIEGFDFDGILKTFDGNIKFNINDGELMQFARLERFLQAGNILSQSILKLSLNSAISAVSKQNSGYFKTIEGILNVNNGQADIKYIKSQGTNMSLYLSGKFNVINQNANIDVYGRIPYSTVDVLGSIGRFKTQQLVDKMSQDTKDVIESITASPIEKMLSTTIPEEKLNSIPYLADRAENVPTREFMVFILGNINSKNSIKYFKWHEKNPD